MPYPTFPGPAATLQQDQGLWQARMAGLTLTSAFQPILSLPHRRMVGYEALLRGRAGACSLPPLQLFAQCAPAERPALDRLAAGLHLRNFLLQAQQAPHPLWLFVNLQPASFIHGLVHERPALARALQAAGCEPGRLVVEVTEEVASQEHALEACAAGARELGCLLALDDFGAGHSNFDRVWRLQPEIVKLDRSLVQRGAQDRRAARVIAQMVSLLHECGSLVLMEGIETLDEACLALDCDADLVQGYLFARPAPRLLDEPAVAPQMAAVWQDFEARSGRGAQAERQRIASFAQAIEQAAHALQAGVPLPQACAAFLALPDAQLCYLLDQRGVQHGASLAVPGFDDGAHQRFAPLRDARQACWARRPYFRRALEAAGAVQLTRPYLSIQGAQLCVTLSIALQHAGRPLVLCGDVAWHH